MLAPVLKREARMKGADLKMSFKDLGQIKVKPILSAPQLMTNETMRNLSVMTGRQEWEEEGQLL